MQPRTIAAALTAALACCAVWLWLRPSPNTTPAVVELASAVCVAPVVENRPPTSTAAAAGPAEKPVSRIAEEIRAQAVGRVNAPEVTPETWADLASRIVDPVKRTVALSDALRAWSATDPGAALVWLSMHPEEETTFLVQSIGEGAAHDPAQAIPFALTYLAQDRELGALLAGALVRGLAERGEAQSAVQLARAAPEGWEHQWTSVAFTNLAYEDAATALEQLSAVENPALHRTMAAAIISGWAERDPAELASHSNVFAVGADRDAARELALRKWHERDPAAAEAFAGAKAPRG